MQKSNPIVLVTGANRGIGKEVSRQLAVQGATVVLTARDLSKAQTTAHELGHKSLIPARLDVADPTSIAALHDTIGDRFGRLDVLINNAAINYDTWQRAVNADLGVVRETLETNLYGPWLLCQTFLPLLRRSVHPRIVNVSSGSGSLNEMGAGPPAYSTSKAALNALTRMLADELRRDKILVNAICPGWVATDMGGGGGRPVQDGAKGIVWSATLPDSGPTGGFFRDQKPISW